MKSIEISVIIPSYNSASTIKKAIESIEKQTKYENILEIIIVDDGSTDETKEIIKKISCQNKKIKYFYQNNSGVSKARNTALSKCTGNYVAFLDSDDYWYPEKIEKQIKVILNNPNIRFLGTDYSTYKNNHVSFLPFKKYKNIFNLSLFELCLKNYPVTPSIIIERKLLNEVGFFNEQMKYGEDMNYFQKFCSIYKNYYILPEPLVFIGIQKKEENKGLSSNYIEMQKSNYKNILDLYNYKQISIFEYVFFWVFYKFKYIIRQIKKQINK